MTSNCKIVCDDNTRVLTKNEYNNPIYDGIGIYIIEMPYVFYERGRFCVDVHLSAPNAPNNMICQIHYYSQMSIQSNCNSNFNQVDSQSFNKVNRL